MKIVTVIGARPQFIKAATVSRAITLNNERAGNTSHIEEVIVHTGQHYDQNMSDIFFHEMQIPTPKYNMSVIGRSHAAMTGEILMMVETILEKEKPDIVLVYGDTNTTLSAALAACKIHIPVAHVEAGLRSYNKRMPEEINRILTDEVSSILFCPSQQAVSNLKAEGFPDQLRDFDQRQDLSLHYGNPPFVLNCGDVMQDAATFYSGISLKTSKIIQKLALPPNEYALSTIHRAENTDNLIRLRCIIKALISISQKLKVVIPMHPRTRKLIIKNGIEIGGLNVIEPVGYFDMIELIRNCRVVLTDSGGLQKEAYFFSKPCVTLRDETEWVELVENGYNVLAGCNPETIRICTENQMNATVMKHNNLYGEGNASSRIVNFIHTLLISK